MFVLRRLDAVLEPTTQAVLETKEMLDKAGITEQRAALCGASGQAFFNTSKFTLRDLKARANQQQLKADFEAYLDGFSPNVQDVLTNFEFRNTIPRLSKADALGTMIAKFLDPDINLSPNPVLNGDGTVKHPSMDNHSMGTVFEELVRKFNEENNEEAGEHWTPRDAVELMANLLFLPIADFIESGSNLLVGGAEWSTLSHDAFPSMVFDFEVSNPPYGKSWKKDLEAMGGKDGMRDPRFKVMHNGEELNLVTRSSDGQLLFLANMVSKMNGKTKLGSRIAEVHNGSSLFTGDAGQGESNIRCWIIENDWLEAIVALPLNMFYNTGIATYIWVLSNKKAKNRQGKVQLIDATQWFKPLRKNLGKKNCELSPEDIGRICAVFMKFEETEQSKIFSNEAFGYRKITVERPLRLHSQITPKSIETLRFASGDEDIRTELYDRFGDELFTNFAKTRSELEQALADWGANDEGEEEDEGDNAPAKKGLPEKKKNKLLDAKTWQRDGRLVEVATALRQEIGGDVFDDHNVFRDKVEANLKSYN